MESLLGAALLALAAVAFILNGRVKDPEEELRLLGGDGDRLIEAEIRKSPGLSRQQAAKRVLQALRRDSA